ncbi:glycogenin [Metarhizium album ARSEF 1941]|uniref:glycogenin glucosyltransferase n=1 Tax=Metarhizium album (strain ARSEF 1941) TaxID=1081103 RepID=A0A0B2X599_METAS|nr:glycogenin [Metarhizium album ARSEF 1941]KHO00923.1 glycogenin [Metarhizium album ARSEF 1941]
MSAADAAAGEQLYATLLLTDSYLPGALVLAHSLRDAGTTKELAVLVTLDSVSAQAITQLKVSLADATSQTVAARGSLDLLLTRVRFCQAVYDYVLPVPRIRNDQPANLHLMNRSDLHSAFTKINLWKQTQFSKIVYIDADVVAYRAPDELFELPHAFSAAPDIGWPDLVNTGVMVLAPNMGDYYAMLAMADRGISFDGADQGLINMHFKHSVNRLSFTYNVTPSAHYQYIPAYRHFQSSISMVHFIGANKPWFSGRNASHGNTPFDEMVGRWWAVYDRHYRAQESPTQQPSLEQSSGGHRGRGTVDAAVSSANPSADLLPGRNDDTNTSRAYIGQATKTEASTHLHGPVHVEAPRSSASQSPSQETPVSMHSSWDAQRHPPPPGSKPEAMDFPSTHYEMSRDTKPFIPPVRYPSPPKNMWYEVPKEPPSPSIKMPRQIFPWEARQPVPSRTFTAAAVYEPIGALQSGESGDHHQEPVPPDAPATVPEQPAAESSESDVTARLAPAHETSPGSSAPTDPWSSYSRVNAWDDVPGISRYVDGLQRHRRTGGPSSGTTATSTVPKASGEALRIPKALKLTDFPTELERPSLPVTPAPIRRTSLRGGPDEPLNSAEEAQLLPMAEGVPSQSEWDPAARLQLLARQQSEALLRRLSGDDDVPGRMAGHGIPSRPLPFGSGPRHSPTYIAQSASTSVLSPQPVQGKPPTADIVAKLVDRDDAYPGSMTKEGSPAPPVDVGEGE